ncbi:extracellular serine-rich protein [Hirsutella rhossiliensis]|uniref:Extracellular serine-rich protein n=1 Tax=Hirsutella rhossiliensis TaxID=111463 RepID=A0A9P8SGT9_9HYPO|nr:extracellular serine-rich protein [Hirsutella rhossiliensis]KAH0960845.1 extracellular serine-rich protein [Hirsutella rhossiliensis]
MQFTSLAVTALLGVAQAVDVHVVNVGKDPMTNKTGQKYWPEKVEAKVGDMVQFQFWAGNHTATQSTFDGACAPVSSSNASAAGVFSGFQPAAASEAQGQIPVFTVMINDTMPKWFYCAQAKHCQSGMVMVINENPSANATRTLENYKQLASKAQGSTSTTGPNGGTGTSGGTSSTTNPPSANVSAANSNFVAVPAAMLLVLGSAFMLL